MIKSVCTKKQADRNVYNVRFQLYFLILSSDKPKLSLSIRKYISGGASFGGFYIGMTFIKQIMGITFFIRPTALVWDNNAPILFLPRNLKLK